MKRKLVSVLGIMVASSLLLVGCGSSSTTTPDPTPAASSTPAAPSTPSTPSTPDPTPADSSTNGLSGKITIAGSTTVQSPMEKLQAAYEVINPDVVIEVQGIGSSAGVKAAGDGTVDIGMASREIKDSERDEYGLNEITIAKDAIAVVIHPSNTVTDLSLDQIKDIFEGTITNWSEVGGPDLDIVVVTREEGSGTRAAFEEIVGLEMKIGDATVSSIVGTAVTQEGTGAVKATTAAQEGGIGFVSLGYIDDTVSAINVGGAEPNVENVLSGSYEISRPLLILTNDDTSAVVDDFIDFILGKEGQTIMADQSYVPVGDTN